MVLVVSLGTLFVVCFVFFCGGVCCLTLSLNIFLKKFSSCCCRMMNILYFLSLHQELQKASQPLHLLPTADTVSNNAHFWWLGMEEGFP